MIKCYKSFYVQNIRFLVWNILLWNNINPYFNDFINANKCSTFVYLKNWVLSKSSECLTWLFLLIQLIHIKSMVGIKIFHLYQ